MGDDGSDEDVEAAIAPFRERLRISVHRREHDGYGAGQARNLAARAADNADVLVFVDSDCLPDHHLVSRYTSLVAVDVTPSRPGREGLTTRPVPTNLPAGWDFGSVFGPLPRGGTRARLHLAAALLLVAGAWLVRRLLGAG